MQTVIKALLRPFQRTLGLHKQRPQLGDSPETKTLKRAKVRFHHESVLERRSLHRRKALDELFRTRTSGPKLVGKTVSQRRETRRGFVFVLLCCIAHRAAPRVRVLRAYHCA